MAALSIPAALAIALHCAPAEDPRMLVGIARQESVLETLTLHDDTSGQVLRGAGVIEAARRRIAAGHSVDLGAWQINSRNLSLVGLGIADAFESCKAVAAAGRPIELFSRYNTGSRSRRSGERVVCGGWQWGHGGHDRGGGADRPGSRVHNFGGIVDVLVNNRPADFDLRHRNVWDDLGDHRRRDCRGASDAAWSWGHFWSAIGGGAVLVCASWVVQTFLGAG